MSSWLLPQERRLSVLIIPFFEYMWLLIRDHVNDSLDKSSFLRVPVKKQKQKTWRINWVSEHHQKNGYRKKKNGYRTITVWTPSNRHSNLLCLHCFIVKCYFSLFYFILGVGNGMRKGRLSNHYWLTWLISVRRKMFNTKFSLPWLRCFDHHS